MTAASQPLRVGVLASGQGTNLQALLDTLDPSEAAVVAVASDKPDARALERARDAGIPERSFVRTDHATREERDAATAAWLVEQRVELVVLAGYMAILTPTFIRAFPDRIINVHPSLLPAFPGIRAIEQAVDHGVEVFGVTVHLVDEGVDTGAILLQDGVRLPDVEGPGEVLAALRPIEHRLLPEAVRRIAHGGVAALRGSAASAGDE
ncbi:MAG: phosphoribosylglycinamide formyltransferase [Patulibacter sp.]|nr:phosphoribosylglycinamide formyltransferase [Patulibacter sp.]